MRKDLSKVLCEEPRHRSGDKEMDYQDRLKSKRLDEDHVPQGGGTKSKRHFGFKTKDFGEHLAPLAGLIRGYLGKQWDKFYSDLCKTFDKTKVTNQHILTHLYDKVERNVVLVDGEPCTTGDSGGTLRPIGLYIEFWVHPKTGCIMRNKKYGVGRGYLKDPEFLRKKVLKENALARWLEPNSLLGVKIGDVWFSYEVRPQKLKPKMVSIPDPLNLLLTIEAWEGDYIKDDKDSGITIFYSYVHNHAENKWEYISEDAHKIANNLLSVANAKFQVKRPYGKHYPKPWTTKDPKKSPLIAVNKKQLSHQEKKKYNLL